MRRRDARLCAGARRGATGVGAGQSREGCRRMRCRPWRSPDRCRGAATGVTSPCVRRFTLDPDFHAGAYYVQEASSQFVGTPVGRACGPKGPASSILCAAPGGQDDALRLAGRARRTGRRQRDRPPPCRRACGQRAQVGHGQRGRHDLRTAYAGRLRRRGSTSWPWTPPVPARGCSARTARPAANGARGV